MLLHHEPTPVLSSLPAPRPTPSCRGRAFGPADVWAASGRPGLFFSEIYFVILYNQIYPPRPWSLISSTEKYSSVDLKPSRKEKWGGETEYHLSSRPLTAPLRWAKVCTHHTMHDSDALRSLSLRCVSCVCLG